MNADGLTLEGDGGTRPEALRRGATSKAEPRLRAPRFGVRVLVGLLLLGCGCSLLAKEVRVVSHTVGTDELLLAVADPEQVAALSHIADDPQFSAVAEQARRYPKINHNDAESVLRYRPTLMLAADYSRLELVEQVRRAGVRVLVINRYATLADSYDNLRRVAAELGGGAPARADAIIADCERRVADLERRLHGRSPVRVIAPSTYGVIPGFDTTIQDLCDHAGANNLAATLGGLQGHAPPPNERMLVWPVDRVIVAGETIEAALEPFRKLPPYSLMPAVREGRAVLLKPYMMSVVTHYRVDAYEMLAKALHPEAFQ